MPSKYSRDIKIITWVLRILCGGLFIFSGFVKAIDPWGTVFKIEEYLAAFDFPVYLSLIRLFVFAICSLEFVVGCFLLMGCFRKSCPIFAALIMLFFLPLTLWIAIENPITECGCFGDAFHLSNWMTFWKNVLLTGGIAWLIRYNLSCICLITPAFQWLAVVASGLFIVIIELIGFFYQPLIDFRGFPEGTELFSREGYDDGIDVFDIDSLDDRNEDAIDSEGKELIVMIPEISIVSPATTWKLNSLYEWTQDNGIKMIGIVSGSKEEIEEWEDLSMTSYPIYLADDTAIEEVVRGNPGIVYLDKGKIIWKSTLDAINVDDFMSPEVSGDVSTFAIDNARILRNCIFIYLIIIAFLVFISFTPRMAQVLTKGGLASKRGIRQH